MIRMTKSERKQIRDAFHLRLNQALYHTNFNRIYDARHERFDLETEKVGKTTVFKAHGAAAVEKNPLQWYIEAAHNGQYKNQRPCFVVQTVRYGNHEMGIKDLAVGGEGDLIEIGPPILKAIFHSFREKLPQVALSRYGERVDRDKVVEAIMKLAQSAINGRKHKLLTRREVMMPYGDKGTKQNTVAVYFDYADHPHVVELDYQRIGKEIEFELVSATLDKQQIPFKVSPFNAINATEAAIRNAIDIAKLNYRTNKGTPMTTANKPAAPRKLKTVTAMPTSGGIPADESLVQVAKTSPAKSRAIPMIVPSAFVLNDGNGHRRAITPKQMKECLRDLEKYGYSTAYKVLNAMVENAIKILNGAKIKRRTTSGTEYKAMNVASGATEAIVEVMHNANWDKAHVEAEKPEPKKAPVKKPAAKKLPVPTPVAPIKTAPVAKGRPVPRGKPTVAELAAKPVPKRAPRPKGQNDLAILSEGILGKSYRAAVTQNKGLVEQVTKPNKPVKVWTAHDDIELRQLLDAQRHTALRIDLLSAAKAANNSPEVQAAADLKQAAKDKLFVDAIKAKAKESKFRFAERTDDEGITTYSVSGKAKVGLSFTVTIEFHKRAGARFVADVIIANGATDFPVEELELELKTIGQFNKLLERIERETAKACV